MRAAHYLLTFLCVATPISSVAVAQDIPPWDDFLDGIEGSTDVRKIGGDQVPEAQPLRRFPGHILGARYVVNRGTPPAEQATERALAVFSSSCAARGGSLLDQDDPRSQEFAQRVVGDLPRPTGNGYLWRGRTAICDDPDGQPLAGFVAVFQDADELNRRVTSQVLNGIFGAKHETAIYLFSPRSIRSRASVLASAASVREQDVRLEERRLAAMQAAREEAAAFQSRLAIGDETNCGTVINIRGPMAEVALPVNLTAPNGATVFWSRIDRLLPPAQGNCTYGL